MLIRLHFAEIRQAPPRAHDVPMMLISIMAATRSSVRWRSRQSLESSAGAFYRPVEVVGNASMQSGDICHESHAAKHSTLLLLNT